MNSVENPVWQSDLFDVESDLTRIEEAISFNPELTGEAEFPIFTQEGWDHAQSVLDIDLDSPITMETNGLVTTAIWPTNDPQVVLKEELVNHCGGVPVGGLRSLVKTIPQDELDHETRKLIGLE